MFGSMIDLFGQSELISNYEIHTDTVEYHNVINRCNGEISGTGLIYQMKNGYNILLDTNGVILCEGLIEKKFKTGLFLRTLHGHYMTRVGLWYIYKNGQITSINHFDNKGNLLTELKFDDKGKLKNKRILKQ